MTEVARSTHVPANWLPHSQTFARPYTNPLGEGWSTYTPVGQSVYSSKTGQLRPITVALDSNKVSLMLEKLIISCDVTALKNGAPIANPASLTTTYLGLDSVFASLSVKAGGETVENHESYSEFLAGEYATMGADMKKLLLNLSGYGSTNAFQQSTMSITHHPPIGFFHPTNGDFFHPWALPNQRCEVTFTVARPESIFLTADVCDEIQLSNIRVLVPYVTPNPEFVIGVTRAIADGKSIYYDYVRTGTELQACTGSTKNVFLYHMSNVRSLQGFRGTFVDEDALADVTKDNAKSFTDANLREWRLQVGQRYIPDGTQGFTHSPTDRQTMLITQLSKNGFDQIASMDLPFQGYITQNFELGYSFQDKAEGSRAALGFTGTDGLLRVHTTHANPAPTPRVKFIFRYFENVTLSIGPSVKVV